jgi:hypothetical protein
VVVLNDGITNEVVNVSSSGGDSPCDLSIFELDTSGSPCLGQDIAREVSSGYSTGHDWFDTSLAPEDVPDEEWLDASVAFDNILTGGVS